MNTPEVKAAPSDGATAKLKVTTTCPACSAENPQPDLFQPPFFADTKRTYLVIPMGCTNPDCGSYFALEVTVNG